MSDASTVIQCAECGTRNRVRPVPHGTPRCRSCRASLPWVVPAGGASLDAELTASVPVIVDLWAPWCGPCRMITPVLEQLARERAGHLKVVKVNVDEEPAVSARYRVQSIPLLVLTRGGVEVGRLTGAVPPAELRAWLDSTLQAAPAT